MQSSTASIRLAALATLGFTLAACEKSAPGDEHTHAPDTHTHADGSTHGDHAVPSGVHTPADEDHAHNEVPLTPATIGDMTVELAQNHGAIKPGQESHLVVKLPYSDNGDTIVRAWIGSEDRTLSFVGKGEYANDHDDYDVHTTAPDPLPENAMWWIEIEKPDGTKLTGSTKPLTE